MERERGETEREIGRNGETRTGQERTRRCRKPPFIVDWVTWLPGNRGPGKAWLKPGDCKGGV